ncbi:PAS domain S-box protein [Herpetosiphon gulosus]|uniref:PAS domain S-box protein n=1 Tax=Herpetosiphon gulosus TaxID=1973496 RepID=A0ABP9X6T1_9CHLR
MHWRSFIPRTLADSQSRQQLLIVMLKSVFWVFNPIQLILSFTSTTTSWPRLLLLAIVNLLCGGIWLLVKRDKLDLASKLFVGLFWLLFTGLMLSTGGIASPSIIAYFFVIFTASFLLSERASLIIGGLSLAATFVAVLLELNQLLPASVLVYTPVSRWLSYSFYLGIMLVFQMVSGRLVYNALQKAQAELHERQRIETELRHSEAQYRLLFDTIPIGIGMAKLDGTVIAINPAGSQMMGYSHAEFMQIKLEHLYADPDQRASLIQQAQQTGKIRDREMAFRRNDGQLVWALVNVDLGVINDEVVTIATLRDNTTQRAAEQALRTNEARFRAIFEHAAIGIVLIDNNGLAFRANPTACMLLNFSEQELQQQAFVNLTHPDDRQFEISLNQELRAGLCDSYQIEQRFIRSDGGVVWGRLCASLVQDAADQPLFMIAMIEDLSSYKDTQAQLDLQMQTLTALYYSSQRLTTKLKVEELARDVADSCVSIFGAQRAWLTLNQADQLKYHEHNPEQPLPSVHIEIESAQPTTRNGPIRTMAFPLVSHNHTFGMLNLQSNQADFFQAERNDMLQTYASQVAAALDNALMFQHLQQINREVTSAYDMTIEGWSRALDLRDHETEGHTQRVTWMTERLAAAMGQFSAEELIHVRRGALLHDIGKMGVPDAILHKPGPLNDEEWVIMRRHPVYAYQLLAPIGYLQGSLDIPHYHHERWDGGGYPKGLQAEEIPLAARVFAVVDVWDALRSDRPYRKGWTDQRIMDYLAGEAGKHFDPLVVEVFLQLLTTMTIAEVRNPVNEA